MAKKSKIVKPEYPKEWLSFTPISDFDVHVSNEPSAGNGIVRVRKYRIVCEEIDEPLDVIQQRIQDLWDNANNHHHYRPLQEKAAQYSYELKGDFGYKIKNR